MTETISNREFSLLFSVFWYFWNVLFSFSMRIITWNVNGIRASYNKGEFTALCTKYDPDILFIQEIKAQEEKLPQVLRTPDGYEAFYNSAQKPGYAGT
jgi:exodeoxyribonuclease III